MTNNPSKIPMKTCENCGWEWQPMVPNPVKCPNCQYRKRIYVVADSASKKKGE